MNCSCAPHPGGRALLRRDPAADGGALYTGAAGAGAGHAGGDAPARPPGVYAQSQAIQSLQRPFSGRTLPDRSAAGAHGGGLSAPGHGGGAIRQLLNTLFVTTEDIYLSLDGENVAANREKEVLARYPPHTLSGIIFFAYPGASPALMEACARRGVFLAFRTPRGKFLARACGEANGSVLLRREQYRRAGDPAQSCRAARSMVFGKLYNAYWSIERTRLDHGLRAEDARLDSYMGFLHRDCPGRSSLALDLMEELRPCMADRFVLTLVNNRVLKQADFDFRESGGVYLTDGARRAFLQRRQERKRETPTRPFLGEIIPWGLLTPSVTSPSIWSLEMRFNT